MTIFEIIKNEIDLDTMVEVMSEMTVKHIEKIVKEQNLDIEISNFDKADIECSYRRWLVKEYSDTKSK